MTPERTLFSYYVMGGPIMHVILIVSIAALTISLERIYNFRKALTDHRKLLSDIKDLLKDDLIYKAIARCDADHGPVAHIIKTVVKNKERDDAAVKEAVETAGSQELARLDRRMHILGNLPNVATLLGLLGTVIGMIETFMAIAAAPSGMVDVHVLSTGIQVALMATAFGLVVAIPTTLVHAFLTSEIRKFAVTMEFVASDLIQFLRHSPQGQE